MMNYAFVGSFSKLHIPAYKSQFNSSEILPLKYFHPCPRDPWVEGQAIRGLEGLPGESFLC